MRWPPSPTRRRPGHPYGPGARLTNAFRRRRGYRRPTWSHGYGHGLARLHQGPGARRSAPLLCGTAEFIGPRLALEAAHWAARCARAASAPLPACTDALTTNIDRLAEDHENARVLARGLAARSPGIHRLSSRRPTWCSSTPSGIRPDRCPPVTNGLPQARRDLPSIRRNPTRGRRAAPHLDVSPRADRTRALGVFRQAVAPAGAVSRGRAPQCEGSRRRDPVPAPPSAGCWRGHGPRP